jgi:cell division protein FtsQ
MYLDRARKRQSRPDIQFFNKNSLKFVIPLVLLLGTLFLVSSFKKSIYFPINEVKVFGAQNTDHEMIQHLITPLVSQGFFDVDVSEVKERLSQSPWVERIMVQRIWPSEVRIKIVEKIPVARWNNKGILAAQGEIFQPPEATFPANLPHFVGPEGQQSQMLAYYKKINTLLTPLHFKVSRLEMTPYSSWKMTFDNGIQIAAGHKDILLRLNHFVKLFPKIVGDRSSEVEYIDLRYSNGMAVKWKDTNNVEI